MRKTIKVGIAEDHTFTRLGLVAAMKRYGHIRTVFDVSDGAELLEKLKTVTPDILLLDVKMPILTAQQVLSKIKGKYPQIKVIIISAFFFEEYIIECFRLGVKAFLPKGDPEENTIMAINAVFKKGTYLTDAVAKIITDDLENPMTVPEFTDKEKEIIKLFCAGEYRAEMAAKQGLSINGVNYHVRKIMAKTRTHSRKEIAEYGKRHGLDK